MRKLQLDAAMTVTRVLSRSVQTVVISYHYIVKINIERSTLICQRFFFVTFGCYRFWRIKSFSKYRLDIIGIGWRHLRDFVATVRNL